MKFTIPFSILVTVICFSFVLEAQKKKNSEKIEMNLHDFMEEYTKPATKLYDKKGNADYLNKILAKVPSLAVPEERAEWQEIVDTNLSQNTPEDSCKACHTKFKKSYKKNYRKRLIEVPEDLIGFPKEIRELLKK
ncbi:MAG: hypothetical protein O9301_16450 [Leptospira sp.]|nr:hypothetical protein [Leptospira sp.]